MSGSLVARAEIRDDESFELALVEGGLEADEFEARPEDLSELITVIELGSQEEDTDTIKPQLGNVALSTDNVRVYLNSIGKTPLLTAEQEVDLSKRIEAGVYVARILLRARSSHILSPAEEKRIERSQALSLLDTRDFEAEQSGAAKNGDALLKEKADFVAQSEQLRDFIQVAVDGKKAKDHLIEANLRLVVSIAKRHTGHGMTFLDLIQHGNVGLIRGVEKFDYTKGFKFSTYATWWIRQSITRAMADEGRTIRLPVHLAETVNKAVRTRKRLSQDFQREPTMEEIALELDLSEEKVQELLDLNNDVVSLDMSVGESGKLGDRDVTSLGDMLPDNTTPAPEISATLWERKELINEVLQTLEDREKDVVIMRFGLDGKTPRTLDAIGRYFGLSRERIRQIERETMMKLRDPQRSSSLEGLID